VTASRGKSILAAPSYAISLSDTRNDIPNAALTRMIEINPPNEFDALEMASPL
jgi:hypothetical protein